MENKHENDFCMEKGTAHPQKHYNTYHPLHNAAALTSYSFCIDANELLTLGGREH